MPVSDNKRMPVLGQSPTTKSQDLSASVASGELRDCTRFKCKGSVEFWIEAGEIRTYAKMTDVSLAGCYVEMTLNLVVEARGIRFRVKGEVRTSDPCLGMGIAFTEISSTDLGYLHKLLLELSAATTTHEQNPATILNGKIDAATALQAIAEAFEKKSFLTRDEFLLIINRR
jgi:hypothetical protein